MIFLIKKVTDLLKAISNRDLNSIITQFVVVGGAIGALWLAAQTQWAGGISVGDTTLAALNGWSLVFVGATLGTAASVVHDTTRAINSSDQVQTSALLPPRVGG